MDEVFPDWHELPESVQEAVCKHGQYLKKLIKDQPTVDAVEVDKFNIMLHHIIIDNEGVPEVKIQIGDRYFILHTDPVDVREVVHGEWTTIEDDYCGLIGLECSHCEKTWWLDEESPIREYHFCPGCGAKMDFEKE